MDFSQFDLNLLVTLDALLTEKNVTHAGVRVHLSQSATSGALARLREFFHDDLLVPVGRKMVLTPLAGDLVRPVRDILLQMQATVTMRPKFDPASSDQHFSLALSDYVTTIFMADVLRYIKRVAPGITFELRSTGERSIEALEGGSLDFLIVPKAYVSRDHPSEVLFVETHTCIAWTGNSRIGKKLSLEEYLTLGHVMVHVGEGSAPNYEEWFLKRSKHKRKPEVITQSFDAAPQLVVGTDRIATVATRLAKKYAKFLPLKLIPVPVEIPPMVEVVQWHKSHNQDPAFLWLRRILRHQATKLLGPPSPSNGRGNSRVTRPRKGRA
jgi:LysR family transcriptional regulator, nod-box dependent transcriptional activator